MFFFALICKKWIITEDGLRREVKPIKKAELEAQEVNGIKTIAKSLVIWHIALIYLFSMEMRTICETWVPLYLNEEKVPVAGFQFQYEVGGLAGGMISGVILDKFSGKIGVDPARRIVGLIFSTIMMLLAIAIFKYSQYASLFGFLTGFFLYGSINVWCLIGSQAGTKKIAGSVSAFISFIASCKFFSHGLVNLFIIPVGSVFAGTPLAHLIAAFSFPVFTVILITQVLFVFFISAFRIPLRMGVSIEKKTQ